MTEVLLAVLHSLTSIRDEGDTLYTMRGSPWNPEANTTYMAMYYSPNSCHACIEQLWQYILLTCSQSPDHQPLIIVAGGDVLSMRHQTRYLQNTFGENVNIYYDNPPFEKKSIIDKYDIRYFPCLFVITEQTRFKYLSYDTLFGLDRKPSY